MTNGEPATLEALLAGLLQKVSAAFTITASTARLAQAEMRLAASSAGLIAGGVIVLAVMLICTWLLILLTGFHALQALGFQALVASSLILAVQSAICLIIVLVLLKLRRNCNFSRTREALNRALPDASNAKPAARPPDKPATQSPSIPA